MLERLYHLTAILVLSMKNESLMEGKASISGAADMAGLTIPEMVDYLVSKGYRSGCSLEDFRRGISLLEERLKQD